MRFLPKPLLVFLSIYGLCFCLVTAQLNQELIKSLGDLTKCLRSAQALQKDPGNEKKMLRFHEVCEMFIQDLDLSPTQKKALEDIEERKAKLQNGESKLNVKPEIKTTLQEIDSVSEMENIVVDSMNVHQSQPMLNVENILTNNFYPPHVDVPIGDMLQEKSQEFNRISPTSENNQFVVQTNFELPNVDETENIVVDPINVHQSQPMLNVENMLANNLYPQDVNVPIGNILQENHQEYNQLSSANENNRFVAPTNFELPKVEPHEMPYYPPIIVPEPQIDQFNDYSSFVHQRQSFEKNAQASNSPAQILDGFSQYIRSDIDELQNDIPQANVNPVFEHQQFAYQPQPLPIHQPVIPNHIIPMANEFNQAELNKEQFGENNVMSDIEQILSKLDGPQQNFDVGHQNFDVRQQNFDVRQQNFDVGQQNLDVRQQNLDVGQQNLDVRQQQNFDIRQQQQNFDVRQRQQSFDVRQRQQNFDVEQQNFYIRQQTLDVGQQNFDVEQQQKFPQVNNPAGHEVIQTEEGATVPHNQPTYPNRLDEL